MFCFLNKNKTNIKTEVKLIKLDYQETLVIE